ncbi:putative membrane protein, partial [Trifolium medium]|nr:putative membrane protein [Trifolium medium]
MSENEEHTEYTADIEPSAAARKRLRDRSKEVLSKQAVKIAKRAEEHETFFNKVIHLLNVLGFGGFCFLLGARPQDVPLVYCLFYVVFVPLRWIYYRFKKWHYYLLSMKHKLDMTLTRTHRH